MEQYRGAPLGELSLMSSQSQMPHTGSYIIPKMRAKSKLCSYFFLNAELDMEAFPCFCLFAFCVCELADYHCQ